MSEENRVRIDKWLWAARFYKTRALASEAINGGHVRVNGGKVKPARSVLVGDEIRLTKGPYVFEVCVTGVSSRRGSARDAHKLYHEHEESVQARRDASDMNRLLRAGNPAPDRRPDKRSRRHIIRFVRKQQSDQD